MLPNPLNLRVYGLWIQEYKVLVSHEHNSKIQFTKFPGGGLEAGEGLYDCLKREFSEELNLEIEIENLFHINGDLVLSAFNPNEQLIAVYYKVSSSETIVQFEKTEEKWGHDYHIRFEWVGLDKLNTEMFHFPVDKQVAAKLLSEFNAANENRP